MRDPRLRLLNRIAAICGNSILTPFYTFTNARYGQPEAEPRVWKLSLRAAVWTMSHETEPAATTPHSEFVYDLTR